MLERWATYDTGGAITGYLLKDTPSGLSSPGHTCRSGESDSPLVNVVCLIVGLIMLTGLVFFWLMVSTA
jgi:hypothetical protein